VRKVAAVSVVLAAASALTKEDVIFILSVVVMVLNAVIEYLKMRQQREKSKREEE